MVEIRDVSFSYRQGKSSVNLFSSCTHTFEKGQVHAIIGHSGCGKTTLLYLLSGLLQPEAGSLSFDGNDLLDRQSNRAIILQDFGLLPWKRVYDNIALGLRLKQVPQELIAEKVMRIMGEIGIASLSRSFPTQLSGGEKQRCAIARAVVTEPDLLLMDEPFSALDAMNRENMQELLLKIQRRHGMTCIMVTHSIEEAVYLSDSIHVMERDKQGSSVFLPTIENNHQKRDDYRKSPSYFETCVQLRKLLERGNAQ
ncbi:ABC-type nitrate/sulfonate/bicarbonate transport system, ATPase component [Sphaerochaeta pleomorpha str. Grapes]|uniref:ABC-type nitrate/sulfonate/bicarbonate transport system, ATPase component n=1 Tax=Sphaerochaeta pleomorpha (strain ATCC BAA-1885 / DSM 22778 / Grapes) TaxID=158190 RepID=G8QQ66_SPHPG|nr:ATP-binding cassette domain-containing protein [Sphaerochaeta pleomorpha]AEV28643.1 ABC-type nitrate/sulfonate/bicarbonate transport system, ATPase component [Sphaerochaeta pleomorpha str. Grapes]